MWWPGQVTAKALKKEIRRRERVWRVKETVNCYNDIRKAANCVGVWLYSQAGVEFDAGHDEEGCWYTGKPNTIFWIERDYYDATSDLCQRFQRDLWRDVECPPRS